VPRRVQGEGRTCQPVALGIVFAVSEPAGQQAEVGGAVTAPAAALVEGSDGAQQLRDRGPGAGAQQFRLGWRVAWAQEPAPQPPPAAASRCLRGLPSAAPHGAAGSRRTRPARLRPLRRRPTGGRENVPGTGPSDQSPWASTSSGRNWRRAAANTARMRR
jgi:hypothetical protein